MSNFRYKWATGIKQVTEVGETKKEYIFKLIKALVAHDPITTDSNWLFIRLAKNAFLLVPEHLDKKTKHGLKRLGLMI